MQLRSAGAAAAVAAGAEIMPRAVTSEGTRAVGGVGRSASTPLLPARAAPEECVMSAMVGCFLKSVTKRPRQAGTWRSCREGEKGAMRSGIAPPAYAP